MFDEFEGVTVTAADTGAQFDLKEALEALHELGWGIPQDSGLDPREVTWFSADYFYWDVAMDNHDPEHPWYGLGWME